MMPKEYYLHLPDAITTGAVFGSPHSGRDYPDDLIQKTNLSLEQLRSSEDAYVDELFSAAAAYGAPLLAASAPRAYVDLNRSADELDPAIVEGARLSGSNPRVSSGLGVIPRVVAEGRAIQSGKLTANEAQNRLAKFHAPYHAKLQEILTTTRAAYGQVLLIDCHSMPHDALAHSQKIGGRRPEVVLGDRYGSSCDSTLVDHVEQFFAEAGFCVARNAPFAGAFIGQNYGRPSSGQSVLQVEIDRSLYMDETTLDQLDCFDDIRCRLSGVIRNICDLARWPLQVAAE